MDYGKRSLALHEKHKGKIAITSKVRVETKDDLSLAYTPGVAEPCLQIAKNPALAAKYTAKQNLVAVVSDGSAVLGLGNIGGLAGMPVMEGKCVLFKEFANVDAIPICLATQDPHDIIKVVKAISPTFGGINLEDIKAPECFYIEEVLKKELSIPVFHDDQHGTAIVILAALENALKVVGKELTNIRVVISGAGAAGIASAKLLMSAGTKDIVLTDSRGIVPRNCPDTNPYKSEIAKKVNPRALTGTLADALADADVFIGVSVGGIVSEDMVKSMAKDPIIFAMANPDPEIDPKSAHAAGAAIVGTGRSDHPNQINNVLAFPGLFRGVLDTGVRDITREMMIAAADAIAACIESPTAEKIIPSPLDKDVAKRVAQAIKNTISHQNQ